MENLFGNGYSKEPLIKSRLTAWHAIYLHVFRHMTQILLDLRWQACVEFRQSDCASCEPDLISSSLKSYRPSTKSISSGQVLKEPYSFDKARLIIREMMELLSLDLVRKGIMTNKIILTVGYDRESLADGHYQGEVVSDRYGRQVPKHAHGTQNLDKHTSSTRKMVVATMTLFDRIFDKTLLARRINLVACNVIKESDVPESESYEQLSLFDTEETIQDRADDEKALEKERALQEAMLSIKHKFGKNAVLKGTNFTEGATAKERNRQIGGHKA